MTDTDDPTRADEAEAAVLGCLILDNTLLAQLGPLTPGDFANPHHALVLAAIREATDTNDGRADHLLVAEVLTRHGDLTRIGGMPHLHTLMSTPPSAGSIGHYARAVTEAATRRRLLDLAIKLRQACHSHSVEDALYTAAQISVEVGVVADSPLDRADDQLLSEVRELRAFTTETTEPYQWVIPGLLEVMDRVVVVASEGAGKRLRVDEPIPTPSGWTTMGNLTAGDKVFAMDGQPCTVVAVSPVEPYPDAWTVVFSDGSTIDADAEHQWATVDYKDRQKDHVPRVRTTAQIAASLHARGGHTLNHAVPVAGWLVLPDQQLPIPPYTLGVWLGDGTTASGSVTLNRFDADEIEARIQADGYQTHRTPSGEMPGCVMVRIQGLTLELRDLGVLGAKTIPDAYLRGSVAQRSALLAGLMDTDGYCSPGGKTSGRGSGASDCEITFMCKALVPPTVELIRTLGIRVAVAESDATLDGRIVGRRWRMLFQSTHNPFCTSRKADAWRPTRTRRSQYRYITGVRRAEPFPMRCISVDSPDQTYLASTRMIPTHNTTLARMVAVMLGQGLHPLNPALQIPPRRSLIVDLENPPALIRRKSRHLVDTATSRAGWINDQVFVWSRPGGVNLRKAPDLALLDRVVAYVRPALVCLGPLYKAGLDGGDRGEQVAAETAAALDKIRAKHRCALWLEHHAPMEQNGNRMMRPVGSGLWSRWPEFGIALTRDGAERDHRFTVTSFRGHRDERCWPDYLTWGRVWPFDAGWHNGMPGSLHDGNFTTEGSCI